MLHNVPVDCDNVQRNWEYAGAQNVPHFLEPVRHKKYNANGLGSST